ncbi:MAG: hypothetical protein IJ574_03490 [Bacilli bacterium]|nr:hypothetical protein [Bacilli bacterium]
MAKIVNIVNGTGSVELINGTYTVTAEVNGYDNATINPDSVVVDAATNTYSFTIGATGTLTLHVTEDGTETGTAIVGATFIRTDVDGNEYGDAITTDASGNAVFNNVPFSATDAPVIYFKQTASDGDHEFSSAVQNTTLTTDTATLQITNTVGATRTINITDANYANLPIGVATLTFTN